MNLKELTIKYLEENNCDGLCNCEENNNCGCGKEDLFPCSYPSELCRVAKYCWCDDCDVFDDCENDKENKGCYRAINE